MLASIITLPIRVPQDVVQTRQCAREIARLLGFSPQEQTAVATAVSEIARNAQRYAGEGEVAFAVDLDAPQMISVRVSDRGPGIADLQAILDGRYRSTTGMGIGLIGSRRLSDRFTIDSKPGKGTTVEMAKRLPRQNSPLTPAAVNAIATQLAGRAAQSPADEVYQQNRELLAAMNELRARKTEVDRLNAELAETNRGVLALYAELDERAQSLSKTSELKSRFLSDMSHELRTPLNAMISISGLLLDRVDGDLTPEQEKQVTLIRKSADSLRNIVNDLLDLAKIEAGKIDVRLTQFLLSDLLAAQRSMSRPLALGTNVLLDIEEPPPRVYMCSDELRVSQIFRNLISNALKFTEQGEVRVSTSCDLPANQVTFSIRDTGIGIGAEDQSADFEDFTQVDSAVQRRVRGTGLGLPLTLKLTRLLGGTLTVQSEVGKGSTFSVTLPLSCPGVERRGLGIAAAPAEVMAPSLADSARSLLGN